MGQDGTETMPEKKRKPNRRRLSYWDAQDKVIKLNSIYRTELYGTDRAQNVAKTTHQDLDEVATPEPSEELEDSELSDRERNSAIARERMRREGMS
jgi:hypothetical protein